MDLDLKITLWNQFGAAVDMLENALAACPDDLWDNGTEFWYLGYHTIFYLDYYVSDPDNFSPPQPFTLSEFDPEGAMPPRTYTKQELLDYLDFGRQKAYRLIGCLDQENAPKRFANARRDYSIPEILLYNMRHIQHGAAQLNLMLRLGGAAPPKWVSLAKQKM